MSMLALGTDAYRGEPRITGPLAEWNRRGWIDATFMTIGVDEAPGFTIDGHAFVVTSGAYAIPQRSIDASRAVNRRLVHDFCTAPWLLAADHPGRAGVPDARWRAYANQCTLVTVPTPALAPRPAFKRAPAASASRRAEKEARAQTAHASAMSSDRVSNR